MTRDEAIQRIKTALKRRSGKTWSVTGGRGTAYGWIEIDVPPARRKFAFDGITPQAEFGCASQAEREELAKLLGLDAVHPQGVSIPSGSDYREEYCQRAEGRTVTVRGEQYWN